jgi:hypothetical protein
MRWRGFSGAASVTPARPYLGPVKILADVKIRAVKHLADARRIACPPCYIDSSDVTGYPGQRPSRPLATINDLVAK